MGQTISRNYREDRVAGDVIDNIAAPKKRSQLEDNPALLTFVNIDYLIKPIELDVFSQRLSP